MTDTMAPTPSPEMPQEPQAPQPEQVYPESGVTQDESQVGMATADAAPGDTSTEQPAEAPTTPEITKPKNFHEELQKIINDYVVPMSFEALDQWSSNLGGKDSQPFKDYVVQVASGMYPTLAPQLKMGIPTRALLDPYIQVASEVLGPQMSDPNWSDPKWAAALQGGLDPKTGHPTPMPLDQWRKFLTQDPSHGWDKTEQAHSIADEFSSALHGAFGGGQ